MDARSAPTRSVREQPKPLPQISSGSAPDPTGYGSSTKPKRLRDPTTDRAAADGALGRARAVLVAQRVGDL
jgi:hypothetical protein